LLKVLVQTLLLTSWHCFMWSRHRNICY